MQCNPYLIFAGQCREAFEFYARTLGATIEAMLTHAETPAAAQVPPEWREKIIHARLRIGDTVLMASDGPPGQQEAMQGFHVNVAVEDPVEADRIFHALAEKGTVRMPIQQTFWALRFGMLVDPFGVPWMVNCEAG